MSSKNYAPRCYESHGPMPIGDHYIYGGSCIHPKIIDADIYVGLDYGMAEHLESYPWMNGDAFKFEIPNMKVPDDFTQFSMLIDWLHAALLDGAKVHVGCIGGHGRTGIVLAALVKQMTGQKRAIHYVRKHYCKKAVETKEQIVWLSKQYGITPAKARYTDIDLLKNNKHYKNMSSGQIMLLDDWRAK
ncbi:MAG: hypothetical protein V3S76_03525 [Candidatus Bipolaricaulota bacterium]